MQRHVITTDKISVYAMMMQAVAMKYSTVQEYAFLAMYCYENNLDLPYPDSIELKNIFNQCFVIYMGFNRTSGAVLANFVLNMKCSDMLQHSANIQSKNLFIAIPMLLQISCKDIQISVDECIRMVDLFRPVPASVRYISACLDAYRTNVPFFDLREFAENEDYYAVYFFLSLYSTQTANPHYQAFRKSFLAWMEESLTDRRLKNMILQAYTALTEARSIPQILSIEGKCSNFDKFKYKSQYMSMSEISDLYVRDSTTPPLTIEEIIAVIQDSSPECFACAGSSEYCECAAKWNANIDRFLAVAAMEHMKHPFTDMDQLTLCQYANAVSNDTDPDECGLDSGKLDIIRGNLNSLRILVPYLNAKTPMLFKWLSPLSPFNQRYMLHDIQLIFPYFEFLAGNDGDDRKISPEVVESIREWAASTSIEMPHDYEKTKIAMPVTTRDGIIMVPAPNINPDAYEKSRIDVRLLDFGFKNGTLIGGNKSQPQYAFKGKNVFGLMRDALKGSVEYYCCTLPGIEHYTTEFGTDRIIPLYVISKYYYTKRR